MSLTEPVRTLSLAEQILAADDVATKAMHVPEWGVTIELRSPSGEERSALQQAFVDMDASQAAGGVVMRDMRQMYPTVIIACAYDPATGERLFTMTPDTIAALNMKNGAVLERVALACMPLVGLTPEDTEEKKEGSSTSLS